MNVVFVELLEYVRGMWRRRLVGLSAAWVVAIAGLVALAMAPDKYEASARVFVDTQSVLKPLMSGLAVQPNVEQQVGMLSRTLLSRPNIDKLIRMADLDLDTKTPSSVKRSSSVSARTSRWVVRRRQPLHDQLPRPEHRPREARGRLAPDDLRGVGSRR